MEESQPNQERHEVSDEQEVASGVDKLSIDTDKIVKDVIGDAEAEGDSIEKDDDTIDDEFLKEEEATLTDEQIEQRYKDAQSYKTEGNEQYKSNNYSEAVRLYTLALRTCPVKYPKDRAVLFANRAAAKLNLEQKDDAIVDCSRGIELNPEYLKALLRRAKIYIELDKLDEALSDFQHVLKLDPQHREAMCESARLAPIVQERNEKLKTEMMGKLKELGNMILRPFGLSTDNFNVQQDPSTGSYSVSMQNNQS